MVGGRKWDTYAHCYLSQENTFFSGNSGHARAAAASPVEGDRLGDETGRTVGDRERHTISASNLELENVIVFSKLWASAAARHA